MVVINPLVWDFIPANAREFTEEVYGWLLGYYADNGEPVILGVYDCQKFVEQTLISAHPDSKMFHEIAVSLPNGIGVLGLYHSHPAGSNIFHSHIDDSTVLDFSKMASNFISVVTNGADVQCFQLADKKDLKLKKIDPQLKLNKRPPFTQFRVNLNFHLSIAASPTEAPAITSKFADMFHNNWANRRYLLPGTKTNVEEQTLLTKIPEDPASKMQVLEVDIIGLQGQQDIALTGGLTIQGKIDLKIFHKDHETLAQADEKVRLAILNELTQRILKGRLDASTKTWKLAPIYEIHFWNIPLVFVFALNGGRAECEEFLKGMAQRLKYIALVKVKENSLMREQVLHTLSDLEKLATTYQISSQKDMVAQIKKKLT